MKAIVTVVAINKSFLNWLIKVWFRYVHAENFTTLYSHSNIANMNTFHVPSYFQLTNVNSFINNSFIFHLMRKYDFNSFIDHVHCTFNRSEFLFPGGNYFSLNAYESWMPPVEPNLYYTYQDSWTVPNGSIQIISMRSRELFINFLFRIYWKVE